MFPPHLNYIITQIEKNKGIRYKFLQILRIKLGNIIYMEEFKMNNSNIKEILKGILFYIFCFICILLSFKLTVFYMPFLIGFIISQLIEPLIKFICKKTTIIRKHAAILVLLIVFSILIFLISWGVIVLISETSNFLSSFNEYLEKTVKYVYNFSDNIKLDKLKVGEDIEKLVENTITDFIRTIAQNLKEYLSNFLNVITKLPNIFIYTIITILSTYFISTDKFYIIDQMEYHFSKKWIGVVREKARNIISSLGAYLKAEIIMIVISFIIVIISLNIFKLIRS